MRVRAKRWRRDVEATEEASELLASAEHTADAIILGRVNDALRSPAELESVFAILDAIRGARLSEEKRTQLREIVADAVWPRQVWM